jgi:hypothetical protein
VPRARLHELRRPEVAAEGPAEDEAIAALDLALTPEEVGALEAPYRPHAVRGGAFAPSAR